MMEWIWTSRLSMKNFLPQVLHPQSQTRSHAPGLGRLADGERPRLSQAHPAHQGALTFILNPYIFIQLGINVPYVYPYRHIHVPEMYREREIFIDNLLVRVHIIIDMILVDRPCATGV
jgi:hypothetical protein